MLTRSRTTWDAIDELVAAGLLERVKYPEETFYLRSYANVIRPQSPPSLDSPDEPGRPIANSPPNGQAAAD